MDGIKSLTVGCALFLSLTCVSAQDYQHVAPKELPRKASPVLPSIPPPVPSPNTPNQLLLPQLKGLILVSRPDQIGPGEINPAQPIDLRKITAPAPSEFQTLLQPSLGRPLTQSGLNTLVTQIVVYYRHHDRPVVEVVVPEQDITNGVVQLLVIEGKVGKVIVTGNRWFSAEQIEGEIRLHSGETIRSRQLLADLGWLNQNPFRTVDLIYRPGDCQGQTDLLLQTHDRFPLRCYLGYENSGNASTGGDRRLVGFNYGDLWGQAHQLNFQFTASDDFERFLAESGSYVIPLPWRHTLTLSGVYSTSKSSSLGGPFAQTGSFAQASARYQVPLPEIAIASWGKFTETVETGFDYKQTNNDLAFGGTEVFGGYADVAQFEYGYNGELNDPYGQTSLALTGYFSPGDLTPFNTTAAYSSQNPGATAHYLYETVTAQRLTKLPADYTLSLRGTAQWADHPLLSSEQLGFGGYSSVRGYEEREVNSDEGYLFSAEVRTPAWSLSPFLPLSHLPEQARDQLQLLGFWDYADSENVLSAPGHEHLSSLGLGCRYSISSYLTFRFDYGWQLIRLAGLDDDHGSRGHLGLVLSY